MPMCGWEQLQLSTRDHVIEADAYSGQSDEC